MTTKKKPASKKNPPPYPNIGKRLKEVRIEAGYSNYENVAYDNQPLSRMVVHRAEQGHNITLKTLYTLLDIYGVKTSDFFASVEEMQG